MSLFFESGVPRAGGRTKWSSLLFETKHPTILDSNIQLYTEKCHEICTLFGVEYIRNYIQQRCRILIIRAFLKCLVFKCFDCRRIRAQGLQPVMTELPGIHFQDTQSPVIFTNVGVDYLDPFVVVNRDAEMKTYISLFICLVTRAIHLEVAEDLSTNKSYNNPTLHRSTRATTSVLVRQRIRLPGSKGAYQTKTTVVGQRLHQISATELACRMEA